MGFFQRLKEQPERAMLGGVVATIFEDAPIHVICEMHMCLGRPALSFALEKFGAGSGGDPVAKMQVFIKGAKRGDAASERALRSIMVKAIYMYANAYPIEMLRGINKVFRELRSRGYALDDSFDPMAIMFAGN